MKKLAAILFLCKCVGYIFWKIIRGQTWNLIQISLEETDGRLHLTYKKTAKGYVLEKYKQEKNT